MLQVVTASNIACCIRNGKRNLPKLISILARVLASLLSGPKIGYQQGLQGWVVFFFWPYRNRCILQKVRLLYGWCKGPRRRVKRTHSGVHSLGIWIQLYVAGVFGSLAHKTRNTVRFVGEKRARTADGSHLVGYGPEMLANNGNIYFVFGKLFGLRE